MPIHAPARWWHRIEEGPEAGRIACDLCPRACVLGPGQRGWCRVREALPDGSALVTCSGLTSGFSVDPIEKKPLHHFLPGSTVLSFGTTGCNLGCRFCQNHHMSRARELPTVPGPPEAVAEAAVRAGCASVAFTYNEPTIFAEYAMDVADACHARGVRTVAVTNGYIARDARRDFTSVLDAVNIDLKAFSDAFYRRWCGGTLAPVMETIEYAVRESRCWVELTTLLIPGLNDTDSEIEALCAWVAGSLGPDVPLHFSAFHPSYRMLDRPRTPPSTLHRAAHIARRHGIRYVYTGNIADPEGQATRCPGTQGRPCGALLVERHGFGARVVGLDGDRCRVCGARIAGVF
ncbi:MAG: AmmeMemoRadiSam system radical SAM enzyme [Deltaproteobacteria bacterium]|nr:AmmeMemoRadiSam system radical SAM enzyme [Deltaproteobacteria bacterium]